MVCSSDNFVLWYAIHLYSIDLGGLSVMLYLSASISASDFMYQCGNIVIHLLLLIHN